jgi:CRP-like cAMP-binding protein
LSSRPIQRQECALDTIVQSANRLLAALPPADFALLRPHLKTVELVQKDMLVGAGDRLTRVFFPHRGIISLVVSLTTGEIVEVAMIGNDSVLGGIAALDGSISLTDAIVQLPGVASTLEVQYLRIAAERSVTFRTTLIRHEQALFAQAQQSAACNAAHSVEARLARSDDWCATKQRVCRREHPSARGYPEIQQGAHRNNRYERPKTCHL